MMDGSLNITLYAPYWLLNKTGKALLYQVSLYGKSMYILLLFFLLETSPQEIFLPEFKKLLNFCKIQKELQIRRQYYY